MQIRSEVFCFYNVANRQTDRQANNDDYISFLAEVMTIKHAYAYSAKQVLRFDQEQVSDCSTERC